MLRALVCTVPGYRLAVSDTPDDMVGITLASGWVRSYASNASKASEIFGVSVPALLQCGTCNAVLNVKHRTVLSLSIVAGTVPQTLTTAIVNGIRAFEEIDISQDACKTPGCEESSTMGVRVLSRPPPFLVVMFEDSPETILNISHILHNRVDLSDLSPDGKTVFYEIAGIVAKRRYTDASGTARSTYVSKVYLRSHGWYFTEGSHSRMISQKEAARKEPYLRMVLLRLRTLADEENHEEIAVSDDEDEGDEDEDEDEEEVDEPERVEERARNQAQLEQAARRAREPRTGEIWDVDEVEGDEIEQDGDHAMEDFEMSWSKN